ncbi:MAG: sensor histidine kinase [Armatimonadota bacterium]
MKPQHRQERAVLAELLQDCAEEILTTWEARTRAEVSAAQGEESIILRNTFPQLIASIVTTLHPEWESDSELHARLKRTVDQSLDHGGRRATETHYSLAQVFHEFQLLRQTIIQVLEQHAEVQPDARELIYGALESAMLIAGERFALSKREQESERAAKAEAAVSEAQRLTESKDQLLATVAHELRTPFSAISNALYVLEHSSVTDERSVRLLESASRQTRKISRMLEDLLDISRLIRGQMALNVERCDLKGIAASAAETFRLGVAHEQHEFVLRLPKEPLPVEADCMRIEQVLLNLLDNAAKYCPAGGRIELSVTPADDCVELSVQDTGIGIEPNRLRQIFGLFEQVEPDPTTARKGIGLGLSLVKTLVEMHGGSVRAYSEGLGKGSQFIVRLPRNQAAPAPSTPSCQAETGAP